MPSSPAVSLVVTDLDGTLWHTDDHVPDQVRAAIGELAARDVPLLVATGRRVASTREPLARIGVAPPAVVLNGALGLDLATGERFHRAPFPTDEAVAVLDAFASVGLDPVVYVDHGNFDAFVTATPSTNPEHVAAFGNTAGVAELKEIVATEAVLGFSMIGVDEAWAQAASGAVGQVAETHLDRSLDFVGTMSFTVAPRCQSKWDGVAAFCARHDLDPTRVLALADGANDLELLDHASVRLVPEVAHPAALERADHVIASAADGGWASVLDHLG